MTDVPLDPSPAHREPPMPDADALGRLGARVLEPAEALRLSGPVPRRTAYVAHRLLVHSDGADAVLGLLREVAAPLDWAVEPEERQSPWPGSVLRVRLVARKAARSAPDAWVVLQRARANGVRAGVALDHVMVPSLPFTDSSPIDPFLPFTDSSPVAAGYGHAGQGGLEPVALLMAPPQPTQLPTRPVSRRAGRAPVVAIADTGCWAEHPWLAGAVRCAVPVRGAVPGRTDPATDPEYHPSQRGLVNGLRDRYSGHGTFIAGVIRQVCPEADILSWRVVPSDGPVPESDLIDVLDAMATLVEDHLAGRRGGEPIDVVSLSLGYYPEWEPDSIAYDLAITVALARLRAAGVLVVCAAGNDATTRPRMPAALSAVASDLPPLLAVGALNPDRATDALFTNAGPWVSDHRVGASVVSTLPPFDTAEQAAVATSFQGRQRRGPDAGCFTTPGEKAPDGGFGVWSGTSFAAPVLAAELARHLALPGLGARDSVDERRRRAVAAVGQVTGRG